jgi:hypothetical protein
LLKTRYETLNSFHSAKNIRLAIIKRAIYRSSDAKKSSPKGGFGISEHFKPLDYRMF